jgi:DNA-binding transcriptional LysR family regulator
MTADPAIGDREGVVDTARGQMELRQLRTFHKVAQVLSFTRAAAELNYAQSSVTSQIKALEADLNVALFERVGRRVRLTEAGRELLPYADKILDLAEETWRTVAEGGEPTGGLVVGTIESITSYRLPALLELLHHRYPRLRLSMRTTPCGEIADALIHGVIDVAFIMDERTDQKGLETVSLCDEELILVAAPEHPLVRLDGATLADVRAAKVIAVEVGCAYRDLFERALSEVSVTPATVLEFGTIEAIKRGVRSGFGVSLLPKIAVQEELAEGALAIVPWRVPFQISTQLAWRREKWMSAKLKAFIDEAVKAICE